MTIQSMLLRGGLTVLMSAGLSTAALAQSQPSQKSKSSKASQNEKSKNSGDQQDQNAEQLKRDQQKRDQQKRQQQQRDQQMRQQNQRSQQSMKNQSQRQSRPDSADSARYQLEPQGWLTVAVDYNRDGRYDALETIYMYDFEKAKQQSESRKRRGMQQAQREEAERNRRMEESEQKMAAEDRRSPQERQARRDRLASMRRARGDMQRRSSGKQMPSLVSCQGTIQSMRKEQMAGGDTRWVLARVEGDDGKTNVVCLGSAEKLSQLDLRQGDSIQIKGVRARMNDRPIVMVTQIRHNGKQLDTRLPKRVSLKRVKAEVQSMRTVKFRGLDQPHIIAEVKTKGGKNELVNMGPKAKYDQVDLREGDSLKLLVRPGTINGQDALIAQEAKIGGETVRLPRPEDRKRFKNRERRSARL